MNKKQEVVLATHNKHKLKEIQDIVQNYTILDLENIGCYVEIPETADTLEGNALQKAVFVKNNYKLNCIADDTGLEVEALGGKPGVLSSRYAGAECNSSNNIKKLLKEMQGLENRKAIFRAIVALVENETHYIFEGVVTGKILEKPQGKSGFGYDPIFCPDGYEVTFAEMSAELKNKISHRAIAIRKLIDFLNNRNSYLEKM